MVPQVAIITDTTACIPPELVEEYAIGLVPIELVFGDRVYRDGIDITPAQFHAMLRKADKPLHVAVMHADTPERAEALKA